MSTSSSRVAASRRGRLVRWGLITGGVVVVLALIGVALMHFAARSLKDHVEQALGPDSEVTEITVRLTSIEVLGVRVKGPRGWPVADALRAERIVLVPDLRQLLSEHIYVNSVTIENAYLSAVRPKEGGGLRILPSLMDKAKKQVKDGDRERGRITGATIAEVELRDCLVELVDATVALKAAKVRVHGVRGTIEELSIPDLSGRTLIDLKGSVKGVPRDGAVSARGWAEIARKRSELDVRVQHLDLGVVEPYLITKTKSGIDTGTLDLDLKVTVRNNVLHAPGTLTITGLKLEASDNPIESLTSLPRRAVIGALADENDRISLHFVLEGDLDNPAFSLSDGVGLRAGAVIAKTLGLSIEGLARFFVLLVRGFGGAFGTVLGGAGG
jgi:hypothetical protein